MKTSPKKLRTATVRGLTNLQKQITPLKVKLKRLTDAHTKLCMLKWEAERQMVEVTKVEMGKKKQKEISWDKLLKAMSPEQRRRFYETIERRGG